MRSQAVARACAQCGERPAIFRISFWQALPLAIAPGPNLRRPLCDDCAGGLIFMGSLMLAAVAIIVFVLAVILW
jgi:hypothetical protein